MHRIRTNLVISPILRLIYLEPARGCDVKSHKQRRKKGLNRYERLDKKKTETIMCVLCDALECKEKNEIISRTNEIKLISISLLHIYLPN